MRIPVPRNRLVALTLFGVLLAGLVSVTLAAPSLLPGDDANAGPQASNELAPDAPAPNQNFIPAVQSAGGGYEEHEEGEEYQEGDEEDEDEAGDGEEYDDEGEDHEEEDDD